MSILHFLGHAARYVVSIALAPLVSALRAVGRWMDEDDNTPGITR